MEHDDNTKDKLNHQQDSGQKKGQGDTKIMDEQDEKDIEKSEHNKEADKIGKF